MRFSAGLPTCEEKKVFETWEGGKVGWGKDYIYILVCQAHQSTFRNQYQNIFITILCVCVCVCVCGCVGGWVVCVFTH